MNRINTGKVIVGGLVAGLVINVGEFILNGLIIGEQSDAAMMALGVEPPSGGAMATWIVIGFAVGILAVWLYAGIRSRYGPGPRTAFLAGLYTWALYGAMPTIGFLAMGMWPADLALIGLSWMLVEFILATIFGARFYSEADAA